MFRNKQFILYAAVLAAIFLLLRWMDYRFLIIDHAYEIYMGVLAVIFTLLGIWIALKLAGPKVDTVIPDKKVFVHASQSAEDDEMAEQTFVQQPGGINADDSSAQIFIRQPEEINADRTAEQTSDQKRLLVNEKEIDKLNLSKREFEVLELMSRGMSNQEISDQLFVSLNTVKTHGSKIFEKMEVKRRTQAVDLARRLGMIR